MERLDELLNKIEYYDILKVPQNLPTINPIQSQEKSEKLPIAYTGKKADSRGNFLERNSNLLEKKYIFLIGLFLGLIIFLNFLFTLILVIKYL